MSSWLTLNLYFSPMGSVGRTVYLPTFIDFIELIFYGKVVGKVGKYIITIIITYIIYTWILWVRDCTLGCPSQ